LGACDVDGDGRVDLLAGNSWFKYEGGNRSRPIKIAGIGGRIAAARLIRGSRTAQVVIAPGHAPRGHLAPDAARPYAQGQIPLTRRSANRTRAARVA
jgi:hypothetical protein